LCREKRVRSLRLRKTALRLVHVAKSQLAYAVSYRLSKRPSRVTERLHLQNSDAEKFGAKTAQKSDSLTSPAHVGRTNNSNCSACTTQAATFQLISRLESYHTQELRLAVISCFKQELFRRLVLSPSTTKKSKVSIDRCACRSTKRNQTFTA